MVKLEFRSIFKQYAVRVSLKSVSLIYIQKLTLSSYKTGTKTCRKCASNYNRNRNNKKSYVSRV